MVVAVAQEARLVGEHAAEAHKLLAQRGLGTGTECHIFIIFQSVLDEEIHLEQEFFHIERERKAYAIVIMAALGAAKLYVEHDVDRAGVQSDPCIAVRAVHGLLQCDVAEIQLACERTVENGLALSMSKGHRAFSFSLGRGPPPRPCAQSRRAL